MSVTARAWILGFVLVATHVGAANGFAATLEPAEKRVTEFSQIEVFDPAAQSICESPRCSAVDGEESCTACRVWDYALPALDDEAVRFESQCVDNGVVMRATSRDPHVQQLLWTVSVARQQILKLVHGGKRVPLCLACHANLKAFDELHVDTTRLADGVLLAYTSDNLQLVRALHAMVLTGADLPL